MNGFQVSSRQVPAHRPCEDSVVTERNRSQANRRRGRADDPHSQPTSFFQLSLGRRLAQFDRVEADRTEEIERFTLMFNDAREKGFLLD